MIYLDTSFVAPYYVPEPTSEQVEAFFQSAPAGTLVVSYWTEVELASLLARDVRMKNMDDASAKAIMDLFVRDMQGVYRVVTPTQADFREAAQLLLPPPVNVTGLRGPDALHLAVAKNQNLALYTRSTRPCLEPLQR